MINFVQNRNKFFAFSGAVIAIGLAATVILGINLSIMFKGGAIMSYTFDGEISKSDFESTIEDVLGMAVTIQEQTDVVTGKPNYVVSTASESGISSEKQLELSSALETKYAQNNITTVSINVVNPTIGHEFLLKSLVAVTFASILMIVYIGIRFKKMSGWSAGVVAVIALLHDVFAVFATFIIFKFSIDDIFIAVILTILGYSLNDTIVVYDRIRENKRLYAGKMSIGEIVNKSINQSLSRSITTTVTTVSAMLVVTVVAYIYNLNTMLAFSFPLIIGMVSGLYSSLCISPTLWAAIQEKKAAKNSAI